MKIRLDKYLAHAGIGTRKEVKQIIRKKMVRINDEIIKQDDIKIDTETDKVFINEQWIQYDPYIYIMLNKPAGYVCATEDKLHPTVIDLINEFDQYDLFPIGRLDKDTEGLLLISNDGELAHKLMSPKRNHPKVYYARCNGHFSKKEQDEFKKGIMLEDGYHCKPAKLTILRDLDKESEVLIEIYEGKFHQIKKMVASCNKKVLYLKRIKIKNLLLDENLALGKYRLLTKKELIDLQDNL